MRRIFLPLLSILFTGCASTGKIDHSNVRLQFLDEFVLEDELMFENTTVGGLSGIDTDNNGNYFLVSDQASNPRIYKAEIRFQNKGIDTIIINELITVSRTGNLKNEVLDLESVRIEEDQHFIISSEGKIDAGKDPGIYRVDYNGNYVATAELPTYFQAKDDQKPRDNGVFEGLAESFDHSGYWVATELPLEKDASVPKIWPTRSKIRITKFDKHSLQPVKQFTYKLDGIAKLPINYFAVNGVTEILEYAPDRFLVLERSYSAGYGSNGNTVKVFDVNASNATNTLEFENLKKADYKKADKRLVFNFKAIKDELTAGIVDNIEGMCFGPELENGNKTLILVSDNNFSTYGPQLNQFILLEMNLKGAL